jgi:hypothetical protein
MYFPRSASVPADCSLQIDAAFLARLSWDHLEALMQIPNPEPWVILAYCDKALSRPDQGEQACLGPLRRYGPVLLDNADPKGLTDILLRLPFPLVRALPSGFLLRLGVRLERIAAYERAVRVYYLLGQVNPHSFDFEAALIRLACIAERPYADQQQALDFYSELLRLFPDGDKATLAQEALEKLTFRLRYA